MNKLTTRKEYDEIKAKVEALIAEATDKGMLEPEMDKLREECAEWVQQEEDVLSYALFPQVAKDFFEYREAQQTGIDGSVADKENGSYPV